MKHKKHTLSLIMLLFSLGGCARNTDCESIYKNVQNKETMKTLVDWVDMKDTSGGLNEPGSIDLGEIPAPGLYIIPIDLDRNTVGFSKKTEARVIAIDDKPVAVFFGDTSMKGILVKLSSSRTYGIPKEYYTEVSDRVAVVCHERD